MHVCMYMSKRGAQEGREGEKGKTEVSKARKRTNQLSRLDATRRGGEARAVAVGLCVCGGDARCHCCYLLLSRLRLCFVLSVG